MNMLAALVVVLVIIVLYCVCSKRSEGLVKKCTRFCAMHNLGPRAWWFTGFPDKNYVSSGLYRLSH